MWVPHHTWAGQELFRIAVDLRGFYLKVCYVQLWLWRQSQLLAHWQPHTAFLLCSIANGLIISSVLQVGQFLGARADFVPEPICRQLSLLQDQACAF